MNRIHQLTLVAQVQQQKMSQKDKRILELQHALDTTTRENIELRMTITVLEDELNDMAYARQGTDETRQARVN